MHNYLIPCPFSYEEKGKNVLTSTPAPFPKRKDHVLTLALESSPMRKNFF